MPRTCSLALLAHMSSSARTIAYLQKTGPLPDGTYMRITSLGKDVRYDDGSGDGEQTFYARTGLQMANIASANDLSADNSEAQTLAELPTYPGQGVTVDMVENGDLDDLEFVLYVFNYEDHSMGHMILGGGPIGKVRATPDGSLITMELRSWADLLRQNSVAELWALDCRVREFGSQPGEERFPCNYDASAEEGAEFTVTGVGAETVRDFTVAALGASESYYAPGRWRWTEGANAGRTLEIESQSAAGVIALLFVTRHPIQVGDKGRPKRDCSRKWAGHNSCETYNNRQWFRGEPFIPASDYVALTMPGAAQGGYS